MGEKIEFEHKLAREASSREIEHVAVVGVGVFGEQSKAHQWGDGEEKTNGEHEEALDGQKSALVCVNKNKQFLQNIETEHEEVLVRER